MEFRLLGAFEVWDGGEPVEIAGAKQRALLALLVLRANEVVRTELLVDELWGERPPRNAAAALQTHISRLRKTLGPDTITSRKWGYVLRAAPEEIDLRQFERLAVDAEPLAARERASKLAEALALWRGPPLADLVGEPALQRDIARLEELRLSTLERRIDAELEAGQNGNLVGELEDLIAEHPLREHFRWLLILALYRAGRQAEALEVYRETRRVLTEELGLEPSPALKELEQAILRQDPSLDPKASPSRTEPPAVSPDERTRRRLPPVALLALLALGLAGAATAIALVRPAKGTNSGTATEAIFETLPTTVTDIATDTHPTTDGRKPTTAKHPSTTTRPASTTARPATTSTKSSSTPRPTTTVAPRGTTQPGQVAPRPKPVRITDSFSSPTLDPLVWSSGSGGTGASVTVANGRVTFSIAADATLDPQYQYVGSGITTKCAFRGNFDARVHFVVQQWPVTNGAGLALFAQKGFAEVDQIRRVTASWGDGYSTYPSGMDAVPLPDQSGALRLNRSYGVLSAYFLHKGHWVRIAHQGSSGEISIGVWLHATKDDGWQQQAVSAQVDNFRLTAQDADCPSGSDPRSR